MRRLLFRAHEWLADRIGWMQYPRWRPAPPGPTLLYRWQCATRRERAWVVFFVFWGLVVALSIYGNLID